MRLAKVTPNYEIKPFDCGDADLNGFLVNDAKSYAEKNIAFTFVMEDDIGNPIAYYSLLNDKVSKTEATTAAWRKLKKLFPHDKHFGSYPAIKIGRFAVDKKYEGHGLGSGLMSSIKDKLANSETDSAFASNYIVNRKKSVCSHTYYCYGNGHLNGDTSSTWSCPNCDGKLSNGWGNGKCKSCHGTGKCHNCNGTGEKYY